MPRLVLATLATGLSGLLLLGTTLGADKQDTKDTSPKVVKMSELKKAIKEQKGKVVVIDVWADT